MAHRRSLRAQALPHRGICIWRTGKQAPGCRQLSSSSVIRTLLCSAPDGDQHCNDHDGSGGIRNSAYDVDDAGDTSNAEIGHVAYLPSRTSIAITRRVRSCRIGLSRAKRESGEGTLAGSPTDPRLEQCRCNAKPDLRYRASAPTIAFCQPVAGIATNERDLAHGSGEAACNSEPRGHGLVPEHRRLDPHDRVTFNSALLSARFKPDPSRVRLLNIRRESGLRSAASSRNTAQTALWGTTKRHSQMVKSRRFRRIIGL
jgi:hypothetical protein